MVASRHRCKKCFVFTTTSEIEMVVHAMEVHGAVFSIEKIISMQSRNKELKEHAIKLLSQKVKNVG